MADAPEESLLFDIYCLKIRQNPPLRAMLIESTLTFTHYYNYGGKIIRTKWEWTGSLWNRVRDHFRRKED